MNHVFLLKIFIFCNVSIGQIVILRSEATWESQDFVWLWDCHVGLL